MRILRIFWAFIVRDAIMSTSYRLAFAMQLVSLFLSVISVYFMSKLIGANASVDRYGGYLPFTVVGFAVTAYFTTGFSSFASSIRGEQVMGTLEALLMTPARLPYVILASSIWSFIWTTLSAVVMVAAAWILFGVRLHGHYAMAFVLLVLTTVTFSCLGILSASFIMVFKRGDPLKFFAGSLSFLLGGVVFPVDLLPGWLQKVSMLMPITHGLAGIRELVLADRPALSVLPQVGILLVFIVIGLPLSLWVFRKAVNVARREGSLVHY
ncbi:MAG: ABC transporter permease [bacterium]|nr:ABC transporter permease [bacterium]